jgi:hypothetical protein
MLSVVISSCFVSLNACAVEPVAEVAQHALSKSCAEHLPDFDFTPGSTCTDADPSFSEYRYPGHVAYCRRSVSASEKDAVARHYGIPKSDYAQYEFDHYIPLAAGGSNDITNLWPQPLDEAHEKDRVEDEVFAGMRDGVMTQAEAIARIRAWRPSACGG